MREQCGVIARRQVLACGGDDDFIEQQVRRRAWRRVLRGVYADHTGPLSWRQRVWAAVLFYDRAAATDLTALALVGVRVPDPDETIHVAVDRGRRVTTGLPGVRLVRVARLEESLFPNRQPPRLRTERAVLQVAGRARDDAAAVAVLADAARSRRTTSERVLEELARLPRLPRRRFLLAVLHDVAEGVHSVLEHRYLHHVERRHALPRARRQAPRSGPDGVVYRDVEYLDGLLVVELDGRLGHDRAEERWADLDRDLHSAATGSRTVRLGWRQILDPCRCAAALARLLITLGWRGRPRACGADCAVNEFLA